MFECFWLIITSTGSVEEHNYMYSQSMNFPINYQFNISPEEFHYHFIHPQFFSKVLGNVWYLKMTQTNDQHSLYCRVSTLRERTKHSQRSVCHHISSMNHLNSFLLQPQSLNIGNYRLMLHLTTSNLNFSNRILTTCGFCDEIAQWNKYQEAHQSWFHYGSQTVKIQYKTIRDWKQMLKPLPIVPLPFLYGSPVKGSAWLVRTRQAE